MDLEKKLYKSNTNKIIDGVCGGIGEYFKIDPTLVRLAFVLLCIFAGGGLILYIVGLIIIPRAPEGYDPKAADTNTSADAEANTSTEAPKTDTDTSAHSDGDTPTLL